MELDETPWLQTSRGGNEEPDDLINVLDPRITRAQREAALAKLRKSADLDRRLPLVPGRSAVALDDPLHPQRFLQGGSSSVSMSPRTYGAGAWDYMHRHYLEEWVDCMMGHDCCWEIHHLPQLRAFQLPGRVLDQAMSSPPTSASRCSTSASTTGSSTRRYLKGYLALTLERMDRREDAVLVLESVMDSAKTDQDQGTFWAPEDRAWLWYNDTIETHAFAAAHLTGARARRCPSRTVWCSGFS